MGLCRLLGCCVSRRDSRTRFPPNPSHQEITRTRNSKSFDDQGQHSEYVGAHGRKSWPVFALCLGPVEFRNKRKQKGVEPSLLSGPLQQGTNEQYLADAPCGARLKHCLVGTRARRLRVAVSGEAVPDARASFELSVADLFGWQPFMCQVVVLVVVLHVLVLFRKRDAPSQFINLASRPTVFHSHNTLCSVGAPSRRTNCWGLVEFDGRTAAQAAMSSGTT